jgi:UDP-N-acetylmuramoyl-tripeptide--D-alanyl-D-alanine ligase
MIRYRLKDVLAGTRGELRGEVRSDLAFPRYERDSRRVQPGDLYIAIRGQVHDGHDFVADAFANGAAASLVERQWADANPQPTSPLIVVDDTIVALQEWARWRRDRLDLTVIGITGSIGKTSTKEAVASVLGQVWRVYRSPGSYNNEIGLPYSLLEAPEDTQMMVLEMGGAYAFGELTLLAGIAQPQVGVVTNVQNVHLERMGSIEAIAETKTELVRALPPDGLAILNGDDPRVRAMAGATSARVVFYGLGPDNHIRAENVQTEGLRGMTFWLTVDRERYFVKVPFYGMPGLQISLVALAVGHSLGMHISDMLQGLQDPQVQVRLATLPGPNGSELIDDTYNASTQSVLAGLALLEDIQPTRRIAVLGDMRELGVIAESEHRVIGRRAGALLDVLVTYGDLARIIAEEAATGSAAAGRHLTIESWSEGEDARSQVADYLRNMLQPGDVVLLKGSRGLRMEGIVALLRADVSHPANVDRAEA